MTDNAGEKNVLLEAEVPKFLAACRNNPERFIRFCWGHLLQNDGELEPVQKEITDAIRSGDDSITIRTGHGVGKTFILAALQLWWIICHKEACVGLTSTNKDQLKTTIWKETRALAKELPTLLSDFIVVQDREAFRVDNQDKVFIRPKTVRIGETTGIQGLHSRNVMLVFDEAAGISEAFVAATLGALMSAQKILIIVAGNPTRRDDWFFKTHTSIIGWRRIACSAYDSPLANAYGARGLKKLLKEYPPGHPEHGPRILGEFPKATREGILEAGWVDVAANNEIMLDKQSPRIWGIDMADVGTDSFVIMERVGAIIMPPISRTNIGNFDTYIDETVERYKGASLSGKAPDIINYDAIGMGQSVGTILRARGIPKTTIIRGIKTNEAPAKIGIIQGIGRDAGSFEFKSIRDMLVYKLKEWIRTGEVQIPNDHLLIEELLALKYADDNLTVESKREMKKVIKRSPDTLDATLLTFHETGIIKKRNLGVKSRVQGLRMASAQLFGR